MEYGKVAGFRLGVLVAERAKTQREFGALVGISQATLNRMIKGAYTSFENYERIANKLNIPMSYFFEGDDRKAEWLIHPELKPTEENTISKSDIELEMVKAENKRLREECDKAHLQVLSKPEIKTDVRPIIKAMLKAIADLAEVI